MPEEVCENPKCGAKLEKGVKKLGSCTATNCGVMVCTKCGLITRFGPRHTADKCHAFK